MLQPPRRSAPRSGDASRRANKAAAVKAVNERQENAKAALKAATTELAAEAKGLNDMVARNVSFFQGKLGKKDPRLPKLAATVLMSHGGRKRKQP